MRIEIDDPEGDWTREGVFEVDPGVYRIPLPLPHDGLRAVNVYAITAESPMHGSARADDDGLVLVDAGWSVPVAREALEKAVAALGHGLHDVRRFLVTHVHRDHYGQAVTLRRELGMTVSLGAGERPTIEALNSPGRLPFAEHFEALDRSGAHGLVEWIMTIADHVPPHEPTDWAPPDDWLVDGQEIGLPDRTLEVVHTPGHTRGHVVFVDATAGLLFAGDHVLPHITPSIGFEAVPLELVLRHYLDSLRLVRAMPDRRLLPAHGPVRPSVHQRVDELLDHHDRRLDEAYRAVGADELDALECAHRLTWTRRHKAFADLDEFNQMLAVSETGAHLDLLVAQGRLTADDRDGVRRYATP